MAFNDYLAELLELDVDSSSDMESSGCGTKFTRH